MATQRTAYGARVAAQIHTACPRFPTEIMDLILKLAVGKQNYNVYTSLPIGLAEFDFLYSKRDSVTKEVDIFDDTVIGTFGGREFSRKRQDNSVFDTISRPSLVGKNGQAVLDKSMRKSREILADQIDLKPDIHSKIVSEIGGLVRTLGHPNKFVVKLHKLLVYKEGDFDGGRIDDWPQGSDEKNAIFTAVVPFSGSGQLFHERFRSRPSSMTVYNHHEVGFDVSPDAKLHVLVFQVFDTGVPNPEARRASSPAEAFSMALAKGFNKVAIFSVRYGETKRINKEHQLRGADKMFAKLARASGAKRIEVCQLYYTDHERRNFRPEILDIVKTNEAFDGLFDDVPDSENEEDSEDESELEEQEGRARDVEGRREQTEQSRGVKRSLAQVYEVEEEEEEEKPLFFSRSSVCDVVDFSPHFDTAGKQAAVRDDYRLGDTLFLSTHHTNERVVFDYAGGASICASLAIIAHF